MATYPDGISRMEDYVGCIVRLRTSLRRVDGEILQSGDLFFVQSHWRGRLVLGYLESRHSVAMRQVDRELVEVIALRLA